MFEKKIQKKYEAIQDSLLEDLNKLAMLLVPLPEPENLLSELPEDESLIAAQANIIKGIFSKAARLHYLTKFLKKAKETMKPGVLLPKLTRILFGLILVELDRRSQSIVHEADPNSKEKKHTSLRVGYYLTQNGWKAIESVFKQIIDNIGNSESLDEEDKELRLALHHEAQLKKALEKALSEYKPLRQSFVYYLSSLFALLQVSGESLAVFAFGFAGFAIAPLSWPIALVMPILALAVYYNFSSNWNLFGQYGPQVALDLIGRDKPLQGITETLEITWEEDPTKSAGSPDQVNKKAVDATVNKMSRSSKFMAIFFLLGTFIAAGMLAMIAYFGISNQFGGILPDFLSWLGPAIGPLAILAASGIFVSLALVYYKNWAVFAQKRSKFFKEPWNHLYQEKDTKKQKVVTSIVFILVSLVIFTTIAVSAYLGINALEGIGTPSVAAIIIAAGLNSTAIFMFMFKSGMKSSRRISENIYDALFVNRIRIPIFFKNLLMGAITIASCITTGYFSILGLMDTGMPILAALGIAAILGIASYQLCKVALPWLENQFLKLIGYSAKPVLLSAKTPQEKQALLPKETIELQTVPAVESKEALEINSVDLEACSPEKALGNLGANAAKGLRAASGFSELLHSVIFSLKNSFIAILDTFFGGNSGLTMFGWGHEKDTYSAIKPRSPESPVAPLLHNLGLFSPPFHSSSLTQQNVEAHNRLLSNSSPEETAKNDNSFSLSDSGIATQKPLTEGPAERI